MASFHGGLNRFLDLKEHLGFNFKVNLGIVSQT